MCVSAVSDNCDTNNIRTNFGVGIKIILFQSSSGYFVVKTLEWMGYFRKVKDERYQIILFDINSGFEKRYNLTGLKLEF